MRRRHLACTLTLSGVLVTALAGERIDFGSDNYRDVEVAAYSRAVHLPAIDPTGGNQIRAWFMGYWSGHMPFKGYVLTAKGAARCKLSYDNDNGNYIVINRGSCGPAIVHQERLGAAMAALPEMAKLDGQTIECGTMDGGGATVEGVYDGKLFRFTADNVDTCEGEKFRKVAAMLDLITAAYYGKDSE